MYFLGKIRRFENFHFLVDSGLDSDRRPKDPNRLLQLSYQNTDLRFERSAGRDKTQPRAREMCVIVKIQKQLL